MKHFCSICGKPTIYALTPPKFCSQCGDDFSVVTKQKDKSVHDQALEKAKDKYEVNTPKFVPQPKPEPKNYPNPARASFKLINEDHTEIRDDDEEYDDENDGQNDDEEHGKIIEQKPFKSNHFSSGEMICGSVNIEDRSSNNSTSIK